MTYGNEFHCRIIEMYLPISRYYAPQKRKIHKKEHAKEVPESGSEVVDKDIYSDRATSSAETATITSFDELASSSAPSSSTSDHIHENSNSNRI